MRDGRDGWMDVEYELRLPPLPPSLPGTPTLTTYILRVLGGGGGWKAFIIICDKIWIVLD